jgi:transcriptional regulator
MYQTPHFREDDLEIQHALIRAHPLGLVISQSAAGILANPVPFLIYPEGDKGVLRCHLAKANPHVAALREDPAALVVFQGAEHYISPSWYPSKAEHGRTVPTWNYAIVQARGSAELIEDPAWLLANVSALSDVHEGRRAKPWAVTDAPEPFIASQLKGIVGVEIVIETIEGKFKASQNRPVADRAGVVAGLANENDPRAAAMRNMVKDRGGV